MKFLFYGPIIQFLGFLLFILAYHAGTINKWSVSIFSLFFLLFSLILGFFSMVVPVIILFYKQYKKGGEKENHQAR